MEEGMIKCAYCNRKLPGLLPCGCPLSIEMRTKDLWDANRRRYERKRIGSKRYNISRGYVK